KLEKTYKIFESMNNFEISFDSPFIVLLSDCLEMNGIEYLTEFIKSKPNDRLSKRVKRYMVKLIVYIISRNYKFENLNLSESFISLLNKSERIMLGLEKPVRK
ncbi:hypothetical protein EBU94_03680, partial [bacterium]|nr:hypothetical protein [bacterium]